MSTQDHVRDSRQPGHFWADNEIVDDCLPQIGVYGFAVYMLLCRYADTKTGQCDPSVGGMAKKLNVSAPTVRAALEKLAECRLITIRHRHQEKDGRVLNKTSLYTILAIKKQKNDVPTKRDLVPNGVDHPTKPDLEGVLNDIDQGTKGDLGGVLNQVSTNKTHKNKTQLTRESEKDPPALALAIADVCKINTTVATRKQRDGLNETYAALKAIGATPDDVKARERWWYANDWRAKKESRPPRPDELREIWDSVKVSAPRPNEARTVSAPSYKPPSDVLSPDELRRALKDARASGGGR